MFFLLYVLRSAALKISFFHIRQPLKIHDPAVTETLNCDEDIIR